MKGSVTDLPVIAALLISGALTIFIVYFCLGAVSTAMNASIPAGTAGLTEAQTVMSKGITSFQMFDWMFLIYAFGLGMIVILSGFFIDSHPGLFVFSAFFYLPIVIVTSAQLTNVFYEIASSATFAGVADIFPHITLLMLNLPLFILLIGILTAIVVHGKQSGGGTGI